MKKKMRLCGRMLWLWLSVVALNAGCATAAQWQYLVDVERPPTKEGKAQPPGSAFLWLPPQAQTLRGLLLLGQLGIEGELIHSSEVRRACADNDIGIVYFQPHLAAVFHFWQDGNTDGARLLKALDDLAARSGHPEVRRVPWITAGHSTAGIYSRNVAYWQPQRVAGIIHSKSGNFHQKEHIPPTGTLAGVPLVAINGQFESFGPEGGIRPELGRETQWTFVLKDIQQFRQRDPNHLMSLAVEPGADHFHGTLEMAAFVAVFIRKTAQYRLPEALPAGDASIMSSPLKAEDGWLTDPDLKNPTHPAAPYAQYTGDKNLALWHYDREMAEATTAFHKNLAKHQVLSNPVGAWLDEGDGSTFKVSAQWLDKMPQEFGGSVGGKEVGHAATPFVYRSKPNEPVAQIAPDTFRLLRPVKTVNIAAYHAGDEQHHATVRWGSLKLPELKGAQAQSISFPAVPDLKADAAPYQLQATASSGLPVHYEVDQGPVVVENGQIKVSELPASAQYPILCRITAHQIGRRLEPTVAPAAPVSIEFNIHRP